MRQTVLQNSGSNDLELLQSFSARAVACPGLVQGLSRYGRFNLIIALHEFSGHFSDQGGDWEPEARPAVRTLN
jgi:hypothetical protein